LRSPICVGGSFSFESLRRQGRDGLQHFTAETTWRRLNLYADARTGPAIIASDFRWAVVGEASEPRADGFGWSKV
jgi:hypothetical protein